MWRDGDGSSDAESFGVGDAKVQHYGLLMKKPFGHKSTRWQRRFFIIKEGFLMYYPESESKNFETSHHFNIHPKGVIPLGGCTVEECINGSQKFALKISHEHFKGEIWVGAENAAESDEWVKVLKEAGKVTWKNAQLGETVILKLEEKSKRMSEEIKEAIDKINEEASELEVEKEHKTKLEEQAKKLEDEKKAIEESAKRLREEKETAAQELEETLSAMKEIEEEKQSLSKKTANLEANLQDVSSEKERTLAELQEREKMAEALEEEKKKLELATSTLITDVHNLKEQKKLLEEESDTARQRLQEQKQTADKLKAEKKQISDTALHLRQNLEQVSQEKETSESKYLEERKKRLKTEKRLHMAEDSLKRLDRALRESGVHIDLAIETDVKNLKKFFEECIEEEQFEARKLEIMREAFKAKPSYQTKSKRVSEVFESDTLAPIGPPLSENSNGEKYEGPPEGLSNSDAKEETKDPHVIDGISNGGAAENSNIKEVVPSNREVSDPQGAPSTTGEKMSNGEQIQPPNGVEPTDSEEIETSDPTKGPSSSKIETSDPMKGPSSSNEEAAESDVQESSPSQGPAN